MLGTPEARRGKKVLEELTVSVWLTAVGNSGHECGVLGDTIVHIISVLDMEQRI